MEQAKFGAVLLAAGNSTRMGGSRSKVLEELGGRPALCRSLEVLDRCPLIGEICLVCREQDRADMLPLTSGLATPVQVVPGGAQRQDSVEQGVAALTGPWEYVAIHDGARPLVTEEVLAAVCRDAMAYGAATAAVPSKDTCKLADEAGFVAATPRPGQAVGGADPPGLFPGPVPGGPGEGPGRGPELHRRLPAHRGRGGAA